MGINEVRPFTLSNEGFAELNSDIASSISVRVSLTDSFW